MKSASQLLEQQVNRAARRKVREAVQPGALWNIVQGEMSAFISDVINQKLRDEQDQLLARAPYQRAEDDPRRRNGSKPVQLKGLFSALWVQRPVLRSETPPSQLLQSLRRIGSGFMAMLASRFWLRGTATRAVAQEINGVFGTKMSASDVSLFTDALVPDINAWLARKLPEGITYLFIDALYLPVRKETFTTKQALLVAMGLTKDGKRHLLGFLLGDKESNDSWSTLLKELLARGLKRNDVALVISDDHKAIRAAVHDVLGLPHQLCVIHKMRNTLVRVAAGHRKEFYADFKAAFWAKSRKDALMALGRLEAKWVKLYPKAVQSATADADLFLRFHDQPEPLWTVLRSTNLIERFNRELRRRLRPAGAMQTENEAWKIVWAVSTEQEKRWNRRRVHGAKELALAA
jgi:transposase-like protein